MSSHETVFQDFCDALWTASDESAFRNVAERTSPRLGFKWFAYLGLHEQQTVWISNYPRCWIDRYFEQSYERIDPVLSHARHRRRVFAWSGETLQRSRSPVLRKFFSEAEDFEIRSGLTVPIRSGFGQVTALTLATGEPDAEVEKIAQSAGEVIELIALYYHARADIGLRHTRPRKPVRLSQRESQCLTWASRGKTTLETSEIMGLTPRTVSFHLENARSKLGASNITQAVALAIRHGVIR